MPQTLPRDLMIATSSRPAGLAAYFTARLPGPPNYPTRYHSYLICIQNRDTICFARDNLSPTLRRVPSLHYKGTKARQSLGGWWCLSLIGRCARSSKFKKANTSSCPAEGGVRPSSKPCWTTRICCSARLRTSFYARCPCFSLLKLI
jgi:hypothetical protein